MRNFSIFIFFLFISLNCFGQFTTTQQQYLSFGNLLSNPGFEQGRVSWTVSGSTFTSDITTSVYGSYSGKISGAAGDLSQTFSTNINYDGALISAQCSIKTDAVITELCGLANGAEVICSSIAADSKWHSSLVTFAAGTTSIGLKIKKDGVQNVNIDGCYLGITVASGNSLTQNYAWIGNASDTASEVLTGVIAESTSTILNISGGLNQTIGNVSIEVIQAGAAQDGYLSTADWNTFNNRIGGSGTDNFVPLFNGTGELDASIISQTELEVLDGITSMATGIADNDKLPTKGYVDDSFVSKNLTQDYVWKGSPTNTPTESALGNLTEAVSSILSISGGTNAVIGNLTLEVQQSGVAQDGYLSSTDWNTFNDKQDALTPQNLTSSTAEITLGGTPTGSLLQPVSIDISYASNILSGLLTTSDWNTFNNKIGGSGTDNFVPLFTGTGELDSSIISQTEIEVLDGVSSLATGSGDNDKLATKGYVDDLAGLPPLDYLNVWVGNISNTASKTLLGSITEAVSSVLSISGGTNATIGDVGIEVQQSGVAQDGYLSSTDWNTFNDKQDALTPQNLTSSTAEITLGGTPTGSLLQPVSIDISYASNILSGLLTTTDWNTFNDKFGGTGSDNFVPVFNGTNELDASAISQTELEVLDGVTSLATGTGDNDKLATKGYVDDKALPGLTENNIWIGNVSNEASETLTGNLTEATSSILTILGGTNSVIGNVSVEVQQSGVAQDGYLSSTDWNTFNDKQDALSPGDLTTSPSDVISVGGGTGALLSTASISLTQAGTSASGYLTAQNFQDWESKDIDRFFYYNDETNSISGWDVSRLATATLTSTSAAIAGNYSYQFSNITGSASEYFCTPDVDVPAKARGGYIGVQAAYQYDGATNDIKIWLEDVTNTASISNVMIEAGTAKKFLASGFTQSTTAKVRGCGQIYTVNNGKNFIFDDMEFMLNPIQNIKLKATQHINYLQLGSDLVSNDSTIRLNLSNIVQSGDNAGISISDNGTYTRFTATKDRVNFHGVWFCDTATTGNIITTVRKNGTISARGSDTVSADDYSTTPFNFWLNTNDYVELAINADACRTTADAGFQATAESYSDATVQNSDEVSRYLGRITANGSDCTWDRTSNVSWASFTADTTNCTLTASGEVTTPATNIPAVKFTVNAPGIYTFTSIGEHMRGTTGTICAWRFTDGTQIGFAGGTRGGGGTFESDGPLVGKIEYTKADIGSVKTIEVQATGAIDNTQCEIFGGGSAYRQWHLDVSYETTKQAIQNIITPMIQTVFLHDIKTDGTSGGSSSDTTWHTRVLNTVLGDTSIVSLSANQFTLPAGTYIIEGWAPAHGISNTTRAQFYDVTNSVYVGEGINQQASTAAQDVLCPASYSVTLTGVTTFELRHWFQTGKATDGLGVSLTLAGVPEHYSKVKITRLK